MIKDLTKIYKGRFTINTTYSSDSLKPQFHIIDKLTNEKVIIEISDIDNFTDESIYNILKETIDNMISENRNNKINSIL
jgi:hypothetical protein